MIDVADWDLALWPNSIKTNTVSVTLWPSTMDNLLVSFASWHSKLPTGQVKVLFDKGSGNWGGAVGEAVGFDMLIGTPSLALSQLCFCMANTV